MNSCLYECQIMHERIVPQRYGFTHNIFMFYVDLDEVETLAKRLRWFGSERFNLFSFYEQDHLKFAGKNLKQSILEFLSMRGIDLDGGRIMLLTHLRTLGHVFNPVSFYFCFDRDGNPKCVVAEVGNTFGEIKPYFLGADCWQENSFKLRTTKYFYISPFIDLDAQVDFNLKIPAQKLHLRIDDYESAATNAPRLLVTALHGTAEPLTDRALLIYSLRFPLITLKVIALIHWHAFRLWLKGIGWLKKSDNPELQQGIYNGKSDS